METLADSGLRVKLRNCYWAKASIPYLGQVIGEAGTSTDPAKTHGLVDYPVSALKTDVRGFLCYCNYYREYVSRFAAIAGPLYTLTLDVARVNAPITGEALMAFHKLGKLLGESISLAVFDEDAPVDIFTDASTTAYAGCIEQNGTPRQLLWKFQPRSTVLEHHRPGTLRWPRRPQNIRVHAHRRSNLVDRPRGPQCPKNNVGRLMTKRTLARSARAIFLPSQMEEGHRHARRRAHKAQLMGRRNRERKRPVGRLRKVRVWQGNRGLCQYSLSAVLGTRSNERQ